MARNGRWDASSLVDLKRGLVSRELFVNDEIYEREQERIFARSWLFVGHESQIPRPGDYFVRCSRSAIPPSAIATARRTAGRWKR